MQTALKNQLAGLTHRTGVDRLLGALTGFRDLPLVLGYHRVVHSFNAHAPRTMPSMLVGQSMLETHLDWMAKHYNLVSLDDLRLRLSSGAPTRDIAALTIDDGYRDFYEHGFPIFKKKGIPAAVFVVTDLVSTLDLQLHDRLYLLVEREIAHGGRTLDRLLRDLVVPFDGRPRLAAETTRWLLSSLPQAALKGVIGSLEADGPLVGEELDALRPLTWEMLAEMQASGLTVGSHTKSHALLPNENRRDRWEQVAGSRDVLERRLGVSVRHFAYPAGAFDKESVEAVNSAGYDLGFTTCRHRDERYPSLTIPRVLLWQSSAVDPSGAFSSEVMSCLANGVLPIASRCRTNHGGQPS